MIAGHAKQNTDTFLVCGLGSLGQSCASILKGFGVKVHAVDLMEVCHWRAPALMEELDGFWAGDCRQSQVLEQAHIHDCRAVLLVTSSDRVNLMAALAVRALNPKVRIIVRSQQENLNTLLCQHLGNFIAFEPTQLTAAPIALAGLREGTLGFFRLEQHLLRVVQQSIPPNHPWCQQRHLYELNTSSRRILYYRLPSESRPDRFYQWDSQILITADAQVTYLEVTDTLAGSTGKISRSRDHKQLHFSLPMALQILRRQGQQTWRSLSQAGRVALVGMLTLLGLVGMSTVLYRVQYPNSRLWDAFNVALVLVLGGYNDLFGGLELPFPIPGWLQLFSLGLTLAGTLFVGILYAMLTERVFAAKIPSLKARPAVPQENHVVVVGLGRVGQQVAALLQELRYPCVGIHAEPLDTMTLPHLPLVVGNLREALAKANVPTARSAIVLTDDEIMNLEVGLQIRSMNPNCSLVLRTADSQLGKHIARLLPKTNAFSVNELAAEVFVAAAFGENILSLLHLNRQTILVTEYQIEKGDTLHGRLIAEIAYGFGVIPILHQQTSRELEKLIPSDDIRLNSGDRLIVLATLTSLQKIESGSPEPPSWHVRVEKALSHSFLFEGASIMAKISGCDLGMARSVMDHLPDTLAWPLYRQQAQRLVYELSKVQISAHAVAV
jgi:Trk K+ transport system NAD-binding subunit